jgi:hypothetical protein
MPKPTKAELETLLKEKVSSEYLEAKDIKVCEIGVDMPEGKAFYAEFTDHDGPDFCYALVQQDGQCKIFNDGEALVMFFQNLLDRKRSLWQRFSELNFNDLISAFIAFTIIGSFAFLTIRAGWVGTPSDSVISKEFLAIVSLVLGFYFGRAPKAQG